MSKLQFPSDDELDLVVIAIQALTPHRLDAITHDLHAIDRGREYLRNCLVRWKAQMTENENVEKTEHASVSLLDKTKRLNELIKQSVYGPGDSPCAKAWEVSKLIASLEARLEALEAR
jgi:hypothetical protein